MTGASIETTLELWASSLRDVRALMRGLLLRPTCPNLSPSPPSQHSLFK